MKMTDEELMKRDAKRDIGADFSLCRLDIKQALRACSGSKWIKEII